MLNRRNLRIKAVQAVFAYREKVASNFNLALDSMDDFFAPDLESEEVPEYKLLESKAAEAKKVFKSNYSGAESIHPSSEEIEEAVQKAELIYREKNKEDHKRVKNQMLADAENILGQYASYLLFLTELSQMNLKTHQTALSNNKALLTLFENEEFHDLIIRKNVSWEKDDSLVKKIFQTEIRSSEEYKTYNAKAEHSFEEDKEFVLWLFKEKIFKNVLVLDYFEELDLYWVENKKIVQSLVKKTLKYLEEGDVTVFSLSENWEEDKDYFLTLFDNTAESNVEIEATIEGHLKNWDMERVANTDKIIIEMAIQEMILFPSIPVKVSMNEYIDVAKTYSTPKSKVFVNGLLDTISKKLMKEGKIKKTGRGLIDNK